MVKFNWRPVGDSPQHVCVFNNLFIFKAFKFDIVTDDLLCRWSAYNTNTNKASSGAIKVNSNDSSLINYKGRFDSFVDECLALKKEGLLSTTKQLSFVFGVL